MFLAPIDHRKPTQLGQSHGFALVLALSLMAFVVLLLLSLVTLVQVETKGSLASSNRLKAEANAILGLQVAIGELQRLTGPDQRISGNALILDSDVETAELDGGGQAHWTGVWDATNGNLLSWLVSGNEGLSADDSAFISYDLDLSKSALKEVVELQHEGAVEVPIRTLNALDGYAYWVSDEGVKAKINLPETDATAPLLSAQMVDVGQMTGLDWLPTSLDQAEKRQRAVSVKQLDVLAALTNAGAFDALVHDLTASSWGLLTNPVKGGLKTDLTLALFDDSDLAAGQMFEPFDSAVSASNDPGGPLWAQLQTWVTTTFTVEGDLPVRAMTDDQAGFFPVITQAQLYVLPRYGPAPDRKVLLDVMPSVTLWNPYDRALEMTNYRVDFGRTAHSNNNTYHSLVFGSWDFKLDLDGDGSFSSISDASERDENLDGDEQFKLLNTNRSDQLSNMPGLSFTIPSLSLEAGQAIAFSPPTGNQDIDLFVGIEGSLSRAAEGENELEPGFRPSASYVIDTGHQLPNVEPFAPPKFQVHALRNTGQSVRLVKTFGSDSEILIDCLGMSGATVFGSPSEMVPSSGLLGSPSQNGMEGSTGFKILRNFVEENVDPSIRWLSQLNPRAGTQGPNPLLFHQATWTSANKSLTNNPSFLSDFDGDGDEFFTGLPASSSEAGVGYSSNAIGPKRTVLFESPPSRDELRSIGQLMHAPLYYSGAPRVDTNGNGIVEDDVTRYRMAWSRFDNLIPAYAIGSSLADALIPLNGLDVDWTLYAPEDSGLTSYYNYMGRHYDYSYQLNQALWDDYFFSSLPNSGSRAPGNHRLVALDSTASHVLTGGSVAANFMIDGAFNINSTSEEAWRAVLSAFYGESLDINQKNGSPYLRINHLSGDPFNASSSDAESDETYFGYRTLTAAQIKNLAHQIVKEVKRRGPFTSLAGFVNRSLDKDAPDDTPNGGENAYRLKGALTAALLAADQITTDEANELGIDATDARINAALQAGAEEVTETDVRTDPGFSQEAQLGWRSENVPGWLTQADLLARLGAGLTARSDTFKIRVYGRVNNDITGQVSAEVWGEATVQRLPEFINSDEPAETQAPEDTDNIRFGRRYAIVNFHWIE